MTIPTNHTSITGKVHGSPLVREIAPGRAVARFTLATQEDGATRYHTVVAWGRIATQVRGRIKAGDTVSVSGRIIQRTYTSLHGASRSITEIMASEVNH